MAKKENTQKKGAQNNCGKTQGNQERGEETGQRKAAATQKQLAKTQARLPPSCCRPNVLENFLLHEVITTLRKAFFLRSAEKSAPVPRSMLHFSLMAVALLLCQKN